MKKTHLILGMLALSAFMFTFTGCPNPNDSGKSDPKSTNVETEDKNTDSEKDKDTQDDENKESENKDSENKDSENKDSENKDSENKESENKESENKDSENEIKALDSEITYTEDLEDGTSVTTTITTKSDGTFEATTTFSDNREPNTSSGTYIIKGDLLKTKVKNSDEYEYWRIKDNTCDLYRLDLSKAKIGWGDTVSIDAKEDKLTIINTEANTWLQVVIPYDEELADGAAYVTGKLNATSGYTGTQLAITDKPWGAKDNELTYSAKEFENEYSVINLDDKHSYLVISAGWEGSLEISSILIGPKNERGTAKPKEPVNIAVPEDAVAIFNSYNLSDLSLPQNFTAPSWAYSAKIVEDETYGKVLSFETSGEANYCSAKITFDEPIDLKGKTLYMVIKGKTEIDPSSYSDMKVLLNSGDEGVETFNFVPKDDTRFVTYSATNSSFWAAYEKEAISDWSKVDSLSFNLQMANYNFQIAAIYYK